MRVPIEIKGRWRNVPHTRRVLEAHRERLLSRMPLLAEEYKFRLPGKILLRPLHVRGPWSATAGRYWWKPGEGFSIAINVFYCLAAREKGIWVMDHEMAHVAAGIKFDEWGHGEYHEMIYRFCRGRARCGK